jgi:hypothetical protein
MQHFVRPTPPTAAESDVVVNPHDPYYWEYLFRSPAAPNGWVVAYLVKIDENIAAAVTCWDQHFDPVIQQLSNPRSGPVLEKEARKTWVTFFKLLDNAIDERYGEGALTEMIDPDDMNKKWYFAVLISGLTQGGSEFAGKLQPAIEKVVDLSFQFIQESPGKQSMAQKARIFMSGFVSGYRRGEEMVRPWQQRLDWLQGLLGQ